MHIVYNAKIKTVLFFIVALSFFALTFGFGAAKAHAQEADTAALQAQISELLELVADLQAQVAGLETEVSNLTELTRTLAIGTTGDDVEELQELLAEDPTLYPEGLVTGYFGPLTQRAVERLQERFGIEQVGVVGPITRQTVNQIFQNRGKGNSQKNVFERIMFRGGNNDDDDDDDAEVDLSEYTPGVTGVLICHKPPGNQNAQRTMAIGGPAVRAHLALGATLGPCDGEEKDDDDEEEKDDDDDEDEDAPVISAISTSDIASSSVTIEWETDEEADSTVWYSIDEGFDIEDAEGEESDSDLTTN
ncbi:MAG: peptidoglycan-binding protein, partial [Candidatus Paceibacterota bacterium]